MRMGSDVRSQGGCEGLAKEHVPVFRAFALVDPDLAGFDINFGDSDVAEFTDSHCCEEQEPEHQSMLNVLGTVYDLIEPPELLGGQHTWQTTPLLLGSEVADLAHLLCNVPPGIVVEPFLSHYPGYLGDGSRLLRFRLSVLCSAIGRVFGHIRVSEKAKRGDTFRGLSIVGIVPASHWAVIGESWTGFCS